MMNASMPSPIGHALAGIAVAVAGDRRPAEPGAWRFLARPLTLCSIALATLPDADLLVPGFHRNATHSVGASILVIIVTTVVTAWVTRWHGSADAKRPAGGAHLRPVWNVVLICGAAHASHLLTDWLGADRFDPPGIQALWPFSDRYFISGLDLFRRVERRDVFSVPTMMSNLIAVALEVVVLAPVVAAVWWLRYRRSFQSSPSVRALNPQANREHGHGKQEEDI